MRVFVIISIFILFFGGFKNQVFAQTTLVPGDNCDSAIVLNVGSSCVPLTFSTSGATNSGFPNPSCGSFAGADIWFKVVVPASGHLQLKILGLSGYSPNWSVYSGNCFGLAELKCLAGTTLYNVNSVSLANQTLFIRVWRFASTTPASFTICAVETNPPTNDYCSNAISLPINSTCTFTTYNNIGCTSEPVSVASNPTCGSYQGSDVWFTVQVPASGHLRIEKSNVSGISARSAIYTGSCGAFTQIACTGSNEPFNLHDHSMGGQTLYIRVWDFGSPFTGGTFNLCAWEPSIPENDFCSNAITLNVDTVCSFNSFQSLGCTSEPITVASNPSCGIYQGGDSWFKVVIPSSGHLRIEKTSIGGSNTYSTVYTGSCGNMTEIACLTNNQDFNFHNHAMAGQTIYIRVWEFNTLFPTGSFSLCAWEPNIPENDFCANAISLTVGSSCNLQSFNSIGSTGEPTSVSVNPPCGFYAGGDMWFKFVVPNSGHLRIEKTNGLGMNSQYILYSGSCGAFTELACVGGNSSYNLHNHSLGGQTIYLRVWNFNTAYDGGVFSFCLWEPNTSENDFCANAIQLNVDSSCNPININLTGCTAELTSVSPTPTCGFYQGGDIWYKLIMPNSGHLRIENSGNVNINSQFALYQGNCGAMTQLQCVQGNDALNIHNHSLAGQQLYLRIWDFNNAYAGGSLSICAWEPNTNENDFCANATLLTLGLSCSMINYNIVGSTSEPTSVAPNPTCGFYGGEDVWFKFIMPASGLFTIERSNVGAMNAQYAFYSGTCGAFTQIACVQSQNSFSVNNISLAGQMIYLRVWDYGIPDGTIFNMCVYDPSCLIIIDSVLLTQASCNLNNDGTLAVFASCTYCTGSLEYAINNGAYQSSPVFNNLPVNSYSIKVRDSGRPACFEESSSSYFLGSIIQSHTYFEDLDGDNFGKSNVSITTCYTPPLNYVLQSGDCNDSNNLIHPGASEITCNGIDENCNGIIDDTPGEINITGNCVNIVDGDLSFNVNGDDDTYFGSATLGESTIHFLKIENLESYPIVVHSATIGGADAASFSLPSFIPNDTIPAFGFVNLEIEFLPTTVGLKQASISIINSDCNESVYDFAIGGVGTTNSFARLDLQLFLEGYYLGSGLMASTLSNQNILACSDVCDSIEVELRDTSNYSIVASTKTLLRVDGFATSKFESMNGAYFIVIKHRNALQTWSSEPVLIGTTPMYYDFTYEQNSAYGNNMVEVESGVFALYSGDINQDENIDLIDLGLLEGDIQNFESGYRSADINGDGNVDLLDNPILEGNVNNFVYSIHP